MFGQDDKKKRKEKKLYAAEWISHGNQAIEWWSETHSPNANEWMPFRFYSILMDFYHCCVYKRQHSMWMRASGCALRIYLYSTHIYLRMNLCTLIIMLVADRRDRRSHTIATNLLSLETAARQRKRRDQTLCDCDTLPMSRYHRTHVIVRCAFTVLVRTHSYTVYTEQCQNEVCFFLLTILIIA